MAAGGGSTYSGGHCLANEAAMLQRQLQALQVWVPRRRVVVLVLVVGAGE